MKEAKIPLFSFGFYKKQKNIHHKMMYIEYFTSVCGKYLFMDIAKAVGERIKEARKIKGLTQKQVAQIFRMTQQQYSRFENGVYELNYQQICDICKLLEMTPNELFDIGY